MSFQEKIQKLQEMLDTQNLAIVSKEKCLPTFLIAGVVVPFVMWGLIYFINPEFVQKKEGNKSIRDNTKVFYYSIGITIVIWALMYAYTLYSNYKIPMICSAKN